LTSTIFIATLFLKPRKYQIEDVTAKITVKQYMHAPGAWFWLFWPAGGYDDVSALHRVADVRDYACGV
jgi:hypothetical protein